MPKLQQQLKYAYAYSGLYRKKWDAAGVKPEDIRSLEDFEAIPILTKDDLRADQAEHPPFGSNLCVSCALCLSVGRGRAPEFFRRGVARLADALSCEHLPHADRQDLEIQPQRPMIHIPYIQAELILPG